MADQGQGASDGSEPAAPLATDLYLVSEPRKLALQVGDVAKVTAFLCPVPVTDASPFGSDGEPASADDSCARAPDAEWSMLDPVASLTKDEGAVVRLTAEAPTDTSRIVATLGPDRRAGADLTIRLAPEPMTDEPDPEPMTDEPDPEPVPDSKLQPDAKLEPEPMAEQPVEQPSLDQGQDENASPGDATPADEPSMATRRSQATTATSALTDSDLDGVIEPAASDFTVTPASQSVAGGSTNSFTWTFSANDSGNVATLTFTIPGGWTAPSAAAGPGQVIVTAGTCAASLSTISGQIITVNQASGGCTSTSTFTLQYLQAVAPSPASSQTYTFVNSLGSDPTVTVAAASSLSITKSDSPDPVNAGANITYTISVSNAAGSAAATGINLTDGVPTNTTFVSSSGTGWSCTTPAVGGTGTITCTRAASLAANVFAPALTIVVAVGGGVAAGTVITNTATVSATNDPTPDSASATTGVTTSANLGLTKTDAVASVVAGASTVRTFTLTISNAGPTTATSVSLADAWPAGYLRGSLPAGCANVGAGPDFTCGVASLASGASTTFSVTYTVPASTPAGSQTNTAVVSSPVPDPTPGNNTAADTNTVTTSANLSVTKSDGVTSVVAGASTVRTFTLTIANAAGSSDATGVGLADTWPAGYLRGTDPVRGDLRGQRGGPGLHLQLRDHHAGHQPDRQRHLHRARLDPGRQPDEHGGRVEPGA